MLQDHPTTTSTNSLTGPARVYGRAPAPAEGCPASVGHGS